MDEIEKERFSDIKYDEEEKAKKIDDWNKDPQVKKNGIKAYDTDKSKVVTNNQYSWIKSFAFIGILALLVIAGCVAVFGYIAYQDGTLLNPVELVCGNVTIDENAIVCEPTSCDCSPSLICGSTDFYDIEDKLDDFEDILEDLNCTI